VRGAASLGLALALACENRNLAMVERLLNAGADANTSQALTSNVSKLLSSWCFILCFLALAKADAAEIIPPAPARYFNDYANIVSPSIGNQLDKVLEDFERSTSSQIVVAIYPKMQSGSSLEDYCQRIFAAWKVGQRTKDNGAVLFVFVQDRRTRCGSCVHVASRAAGARRSGALESLCCGRERGHCRRPRKGTWREGDCGACAGPDRSRFLHVVGETPQRLRY
jgi:hypothetical protein